MHKNTYTAKCKIGNWQEERSTEDFELSNAATNSHLPNPSYNKYVPISKDIGNTKEYKKVSCCFYNLNLFLNSNHLIMPLKTGLTSNKAFP